MYPDDFLLCPKQKQSEKRNVMVQADDPISFMQLMAKNEMSSKEDQFQLSLLAAMGNTQRKEASDPLASKLSKVQWWYLTLHFNEKLSVIIIPLLSRPHRLPSLSPFLCPYCICSPDEAIHSRTCGLIGWCYPRPHLIHFPHFCFLPTKVPSVHAFSMPASASNMLLVIPTRCNTISPAVPFCSPW